MHYLGLKKITLLAAFFVNSVYCHIDDLKFNGTLVATASSSKAGGQIFTPGQKVSVNWEVTIAHTGATTYISYSTNGGPWVEITTFPGQTNNLGIKTYSWTIPTINSNSVKLRVYQAHIPSSNPENNSSDDYNLVSGIFSVQNNAMGISHQLQVHLDANFHTKTFSALGRQFKERNKDQPYTNPVFRKSK